MLKFRNLLPSYLILSVLMTACSEPATTDEVETSTRDLQEEVTGQVESVENENDSDADALLEETEALEAKAREDEEADEQAKKEMAADKPAKVKSAAPISYSGPGQLVTVETRLGRVVIKLHDETPGHRDNFIKLANDGFFEGTTFHRVMEGFMVQGGDPLSKDPHLTNDGQGGPGYTQPAEIVRGLFHKKGAVAAARMNDQMNPERDSNGSQFYIVHGGNEITDELLDQMQERVRKGIPDPNYTFTDEERAEYLKNGGPAFLDGQYTVFGQVVEGLDVVEAMGKTETYRKAGNTVLGDQPTEKLIMTVKVIPNAG